MNKKLLAIAVAAALAPVAAMADSGNVTIYGIMDVSYDSVNTGYDAAKNGTAADGARVNRVQDNSSRLGFKGTESLGNGLSAVWQIESAITADGAAPAAGFQGTTGGTLNGRDTFVGLTGGFGTAILGRHDTPYKMSTRGMDLFGDGIADNRSIMGGGGAATLTVPNSVGGCTTAAGCTVSSAAGAGASFDGRQSNVIAYITPTVSGVTGAIGYVAGGENALTSGSKEGNAWSAMANYANGPIYAALAYEEHNIGDQNTGATGSPTSGTLASLADRSEKAWKLGMGYKADAFVVNLAYEKTSDDFNKVFGLGKGGDDLFGHSAWYLSGGYTFGNNMVKAAYTKAGDQASADNSGAKQWSLGIDHNFSKRTKIYALYTKLTNDDHGMYSLSGGNSALVSSGATLGTGGNSVASSPSAVSIGMRHSF